MESAAAAAAVVEVVVAFRVPAFFVNVTGGGGELLMVARWIGKSGGRAQREEETEAKRIGIFTRPFHPYLSYRVGAASILHRRNGPHDGDPPPHVACVERNSRGLQRPLRTGNKEAIIIAARENRDVRSD